MSVETDCPSVYPYLTLNPPPPADEWEKQKPVEGHLKPGEALQQLQLSEARLQRLKEERDNVSRAKEALELGDVVASAADDRLAVAFEELHDLKVGDGQGCGGRGGGDEEGAGICGEGQWTGVQ